VESRAFFDVVGSFETSTLLQFVASIGAFFDVAGSFDTSRLLQFVGIIGAFFDVVGSFETSRVLQFVGIIGAFFDVVGSFETSRLLQFVGIIGAFFDASQRSRELSEASNSAGVNSHSSLELCRTGVEHEDGSKLPTVVSEKNSELSYGSPTCSVEIDSLLVELWLCI
jgi:hypothetical protein